MPLQHSKSGFEIKLIKSTAHCAKAGPRPDTLKTFSPPFFINMEQSGDHELLLPEVFTIPAIFLTQSTPTTITDTFIAKFSICIGGFSLYARSRSLNGAVVWIYYREQFISFKVSKAIWMKAIFTLHSCGSTRDQSTLKVSSDNVFICEADSLTLCKKAKKQRNSVLWQCNVTYFCCCPRNDH